MHGGVSRAVGWEYLRRVSTQLRPIVTSDAPTPAGHYSQAVVAGNLVFVSGQLPIDPRTRAPVGGSLAQQTQQALENVAAIVRAAGSDLRHIAKMTLYIPDVSGWDEVNRTYTAFFGDHKPARAVVPSRDLHHGVGIEIEAVAVIPG